jgi:hypothetical protein
MKSILILKTVQETPFKVLSSAIGQFSSFLSGHLSLAYLGRKICQNGQLTGGFLFPTGDRTHSHKAISP